MSVGEALALHSASGCRDDDNGLLGTATNMTETPWLFYQLNIEAAVEHLP